MRKTEKTLIKVLKGDNDFNIDFKDIINLLIYYGFTLRQKGSHHIFTKEHITEIINIQPTENNKAKPYQVKQIRNLFNKYNLGEIQNEQIRN